MLPPLDAQPSSQMQHRGMLAQLLCQSERSDTEAAHVAEGHRRAGRCRAGQRWQLQFARRTVNARNKATMTAVITKSRTITLTNRPPARVSLCVGKEKVRRIEGVRLSKSVTISW
jgi:hypothetical protein